MKKKKEELREPKKNEERERLRAFVSAKKEKTTQ